MADKAFTESGISDFNKDLEANIKRLERLSKAADNASGSVSSLSDTYNTLAQLAEGKLQFKVSGLKSLKFLIDIDDAKFSKLTKNLAQLDSISKKFDIQFNVSGLRDINRLQNINIEKIKDSLKSLEEAAKDFQNIDISNTINVSDDLVKGLSRLERLSRFDINKLSDNLKNIRDTSKDFEDIDINNVINVSDDLVKGLSRLERLSRFDVGKLSDTLKSIKEASKDFEDINIDAVINVSDGLVKGLSQLERLSRFDVNKLNNTIKELQDVASEPINIDMNINIDEGELAKLKELNNLLKNYKLLNRINNTNGGGSNTGSKGSKGGKSKNDLFFTITRLSDTATSAIKPVSSLASNITKLGIATGGTIAALTLLAKITVEAQKNTSNYARSMTVMNKELSLLDKRSLDTTNKINTLNNRMSNLMQGLGNLLSPVLDFVVDLAEVATSFLPSGEREDIIGTTKAGISSTSHQSGMTWGTTDTLADNTYNIALGLSSKYAEQASVIADKLANAWQTGSEAAKDYGVVLNDNVLTGYLWNKGIDIANVEITDAMKQYYRYQLMVDQTSGKVTDSMIKDWTSLGFMIDKTKGKLFSFDEVIQLVAADPTIPDLVGDNTEGVTPEPTIASGGLFTEATSNIDNSTDNLNEAAGLLDGAANKLAITEGNNADRLLLAGDNMNTAANNMLDSADRMLLAAENMSNVSDVIIVAFSSIYDYIVQGAQVLNSAINESVNQAASVLNTASENGIALLNQATSSGINALTNATSYMNSSLMSTTESGLMAISNATSSGVNNVNTATDNGVDNIIEVTNYSVSEVSNTGKSWVSQIQQVGQQILAKMASYAAQSSVGSTIAGALGLGQHWNIGANIAKDAKANVNNSNSTFGKIGGIAKGTVTGTAKGAMANTAGMISSPYDLITEGADLINSLKNEETGKYEWGKLPSSALNMVWSSLKNPLKAISTGAKYGYNTTKENTGSTILGGLGGLTGGIANAVGYGLLEAGGDLVNLTELVQDATIGGYNAVTGNNIKGSEGLHSFSKGVDQLLNDMVTGSSDSPVWDANEWNEYFDWVANGFKFSDGGIGTHEIHNATLFEDDKKEAVIPLETSEGIDYLATAMSRAGAGNSNSSGDIVINLTLSGLNLANNDAEWERVGRKIGEIIDIQRQRRGELNYGSSF